MRRLHLLDSHYDNLGRYIMSGSEVMRAFIREVNNYTYNNLNNILQNMDISEVEGTLSEEGIAMLNEYLANEEREIESAQSIQNNEEPASTVEEVSPGPPIIPENSKTLLMNEFTSRFNSAIWYDKILTKKVILAGVGGIGSYVGLLLSRLQIQRIEIYDPDIVESVNISGQLYPLSSIGDSKTSALIRLMREFSSYYNYNAHTGRFDEHSNAGPIMICGFDNMQARKIFFAKWHTYVNSLSTEDRKNCLYIDGRLAAEEFQILSIQGDDERAIDEYKNKWLFSDDEAEATICSYKQTTFMANMIASMMVNVFVNFVANQSDPAPIIPRDIPFFISYSADTMFTKVEM